MSRGWQTILIKKGEIPIWESLNEYLKRNFIVFEHNSLTMEDFGYFLKENPEIRKQANKIIMTHETGGNWTQLLTDQILSRDDYIYRDLPDYMYSNGSCSFITEQKLNAFWYGFVDRYYWWYEVFQSGQVVNKWYSNSKLDKQGDQPPFLEEILDISAGDFLVEIPQDIKPEDSIDIMNRLVRMPILKNIMPLRYISIAMHIIRPGYQKTKYEQSLAENFGKKTKTILYT